MDKDLVKRAYSEAQDSLKDKQVEEVKRIVLKTLEKIERLKDDKDKAQENVKDIEERIKLLKLDLDDLKDGRLDRLAERQEKDERAKQTSVVIIIKERVIEREVAPWYWPWRVIWHEPWYQSPVIYTNTPLTAGTTTTISNGNMGGEYDGSIVDYSPTISCSSAKWASSGSYDVNGHIVNFR